MRRRRPAPYRFTPARRRALDAARRKRTFAMTPAKWAALRKAVEANRRNFRMTPARRRAMRANALRMQRASVEKFRMTEARRRAAAANLRRAQAAPRPPSSRRRSRFSHLQHGLQARSFFGTLKRLGEDRRKFRELEEGFRQVFVPRGEAEAEVVQAIARATWRRLRLFRAQAVWEWKRVKRLFQQVPPLPRLDLETTRTRAYLLLIALAERERFDRFDRQLIHAVERDVRRLLRLRAEGRGDYGLYARESRRIVRKYQRQERELMRARRDVEETEANLELRERLAQGGPEVDAALAQTRARWGWPEPAG
jgi:hypothetical protein